MAAFAPILSRSRRRRRVGVEEGEEATTQETRTAVLVLRTVPVVVVLQSETLTARLHVRAPARALDRPSDEEDASRLDAGPRATQGEGQGAQGGAGPGRGRGASPSHRVARGAGLRVHEAALVLALGRLCRTQAGAGRTVGDGGALAGMTFGIAVHARALPLRTTCKDLRVKIFAFAFALRLCVKS